MSESTALYYAIDHLRTEEKFTPYLIPDSIGHTIGYGLNLQTRGLSLYQAEWLLNDVVMDEYGTLAKYPWFQQLSAVRQGCLLEMAYQMGAAGVLKFVNTIDAIQRGEFDLAADHMTASKWATKDSPARAARVIERFRRG